MWTVKNRVLVGRFIMANHTFVKVHSETYFAGNESRDAIVYEDQSSRWPAF
jgi:hypothetical protein